MGRSITPFRSIRAFETLIASASDILYVLDRTLTIRYWSPGAQEALGWSAEEVLGNFGPSYLHPDDAAHIGPPPEDRRGEKLQMSYRVRHKDGTWRTLDAVVTNLLGDPEIDGVVVNARDATERQRLAAGAAEAQRLESLGRLAGGIAHEFNNLHTVILNAAQLALRTVEAGAAPAVGDLDTIVHATQRASALTQQLLAFARQQVVHPIVIDANAWLTGQAPFLERLVGEHVVVALELAPDAGRLRCDATQLRHALINLVVGAQAAMPHGGRLTLTTSRITDAEGEFVRIRVADTGHTLSPDARSHLFEPFFRDSARGAGGLELAMVYGIVLQAGGRVRVDSGPGPGTTIDVDLPATDAATTEDTPASARRTTSHETVLIVEDESAIRVLAARILRGAGYQVQTAPSGNAAIELAAPLAQLDLLLTDVVMPGIDGVQTADAIRVLHPGVKVLFMSGFPGDVLGDRGESGPRQHFLPKPFAPDDLVAAVAATLRAP